MKYKVNEEIFASLEDAEVYCLVNDIPLDNIEEVEDEEIPVGSQYCKTHPDDPRCIEHKKKIHGETPDVVPDENSAMTYLDILRTQKDKGSEPIYYENKPKQYEKPLTTSTFLREGYLRGYEALTDERLISCPFCREEWTAIVENQAKKGTETLAFGDQHKDLEGKVPLARLIHIKQKHVPVYDFLVKAGIITQYKMVQETRKDIGLKPVSEEGIQNLSNEMLAIELSKPENKESLKKFYRKWIETLQSR